MAKLKNLYAREILDSRATPTIETVAVLESGHYGVSSVPSGALSPTGTYESIELRDNDPNRYFGKGVLKAVGYVNQEISARLLGQEFTSLSQIDTWLTELDGTPNKSRLGANSILSVSMASAKALASAVNTPLYRYLATIAANTSPLFIPTPVFNMINGGRHGAGNLDFQEFHIIPNKSIGSFASQLQIGAEIYHTIKNLLSRRGAIHSVGDEGGFAPNLFTNLDALEILSQSIIECHKKPTVDVELGLDIAANSFFQDGKYIIKDRSSPMESAEFIDYLHDLNNQYHLKLLEDPLHEDDWKGWIQLTQDLGSTTTIVGDDFLATHKDKVTKAISEKACTAAIIKPNQVGTVTETIAVAKTARDAGWKINVSHRSGETNDTFIADFAVGIGADYAKFGAPARGERVAKYNHFLTIEAELAQNRS
ncbi:phosphopyruvate hydratase [Candidatus Amesbacteria bacterium RIFCSPHIGHO2_02_FULL_48_21]|uniref:Enolase n=2 Tax=Candidatus Amesiibacteriota TaxID=1752730 RepID=A0A1F4ZXW8_9BACT|nr:MAG: Enolase [Candidatus Amesbacteria bacterium GW2011_GWA2_47_11]OGC97197.1 MAG: phosphopyruvate hydratase [Candidatus Amesbacteria bacterium RIFCSPHIGHO2_02_FULL_48_21]OGC98711.1 MAG: phosphopyruvate hydratase [Candidatus Amesbacteria bacterium RBG_16_48_31]OGC99819.1 MAG: phosphopyruvate hydratase [Candidatus Amesbacteria bacterium RIFCSPHIGHO2_01_FULL_48_75]OGD11120.1 MAG: phosphopyruvate hydratase [Candidatus Amesbacteria bacterium RIFOXYD1_FULL_47_9]